MVTSTLPSVSLPLTSFYGGAVGLLFALLSFRAFAYRASKGPKAFFGDKNIPEAPKLQGIARSQGNLAEFFGAFIILFALLEFNKITSTSTLNLLGGLFLAARLSHAFQLSNPDKAPVPFRGFGFLGTVIPLAIASFLNVQYGFSNK